MADNYLENKYESFRKRQEAEKQAKCRIWKKRLDEYRKKMEAGQVQDNGNTFQSPEK